MLRPIIAESFFPNCIYKAPSQLKSLGRGVEALYKATIPAFPELQTNHSIDFTLYPFSDYFDGIIGLDELRNFKLNMDFENQVLYNEHIQIPFFYREKSTQFHFKIELPAHETIDQKFYVDKREGEIIIPSQNINGLYIPETLTYAENFKARFEIQNNTDKTLCVEFFEPFKAYCIDTEQFEIYNLENTLPTYTEYEQTDKKDLTSQIRTDHMNREEKDAILKLINKFTDIFHDNDSQLSFTNEIKHEIKTSDELPIHTKTYRFPFCHKTEVNKQINKMLTDGIIKPSQSPWSSPIWIVPKKSDASGIKKWRIVVDYRKLNEKTIDDRYPIPNIEDILDKLGKCNYFTTLDLASGFHQIEMNKNSIQKTAFNVENGHYEYLRMPFGLKNAPATFQRVMDHVLRDLQNKICLVYMDDIIIFSTSLQEHISNLKQVFQKLRDLKLKIQLDKSEFLKQNVEFLGHVITPQGIKPNPNKIKAIQKFPLPSTAKEIKSFLGLLGFYRKFIKDFAKITKSFTRCLKKGEKIVHTPEYLEAFERCKNILSNGPLLQYPDFDKPFILTTDASNYAIGAVLSQGPLGSDKPIAFASRTLNAAEQNYSTIEKELLSCVNFTKYFRPYLFGRKFTIITDHKPLQWLNNLKEPNSRLMRWRLKLMEYDYEIIYKKGKENKVADALSRIEINPIENENQSVIANADDSEHNRLHDFPEITFDDLVDLENAPIKNLEPYNVTEQPPQKKINVISNVTLPNERPPISNETQHSAIENPVLEIPISENCLNKFKNQIVLNISNDALHARISIKKPFNEKNRLHICIPSRNLEEDLIRLFKDYVKPKVLYGLYTSPEYIQIVITLLQKYFKSNAFKLIQTNTYLKDIEKEEEQLEKIRYHHETKTVHRGINETVQALSKTYYWPHLSDKVTEYINTCVICMTSKYERHPNEIKLKPTPIGEYPFEHIYIDTLSVEKQKFLTLIDSFSRFAQAYPTFQTSVDILDNLLKFISHYGIPKKITCDLGTEFKNTIFENFCQAHKINVHYITAKNSNSNSPIERLHSTLIEELRVLRQKTPREPITTQMLYAILGYNNTIHSSTKYTPFQIIKGNIHLETPYNNTENKIMSDFLEKHTRNLNIINEIINENNFKLKDLSKANTNRNDPETVEKGDTVYIKQNNRGKLLPLYKKREAIEDLIEKVKTNKGNYHKKCMKPKRKTIDKRTLVSDANTTGTSDQRAGPSNRVNSDN